MSEEMNGRTLIECYLSILLAGSSVFIFHIGDIGGEKIKKWEIKSVKSTKIRFCPETNIQNSSPELATHFS